MVIGHIISSLKKPSETCAFLRTDFPIYRQLIDLVLVQVSFFIGVYGIRSFDRSFLNILFFPRSTCKDDILD